MNKLSKREYVYVIDPGKLHHPIIIGLDDQILQRKKAFSN